MDSTHDKKRMNVEGDRLSSLPDDLIHKILSFIGLKDAIGTSALSSKWRSIWTSMPYLNFSSEDFSTLPKFSKFVTNVLSRLNGQLEVSSVNFRSRGKVSQVFVRKMMSYAFFHNVQQLNITCLLENGTEFPLSLFRSQSLKHLSLTRERVSQVRCKELFLLVKSTWDLPALTTLYLHGVILFCDDANDKCNGLFSKCANLKILSLKECRIGSNGFSMCHPTLSDLTLEIDNKSVNVVAPHLKNLNITERSTECPYLISAPNLASVVYRGFRPLQLNTNGFPSLEKADICVTHPRDADAHNMVFLLQQLHNVQILKLSQETVEFLSSSMELISYQPSAFTNLKSLMIYPRRVFFYGQAPKKVIMSTKVKSYLLDSSPGATLTMVLHEEIKAKKLMSELRVLLEQEKANTKTKRAPMEHGNVPMESHNAKMNGQGKPQSEKKTSRQVGGHMMQIRNCWENLMVQIEQRKAQACLIFSNLQQIEELLTVLPASRRAMIQPCFSGLCAEADLVTSKTTDCVKMQCDENQSLLSVCFHELANTLDNQSS